MGTGVKRGRKLWVFKTIAQTAAHPTKAYLRIRHAWGASSTAADNRPMVELGLAWGAGIPVAALRTFHTDVLNNPILYTYLYYAHAVNIRIHAPSSFCMHAPQLGIHAVNFAWILNNKSSS